MISSSPTNWEKYQAFVLRFFSSSDAVAASNSLLQRLDDALLFFCRGVKGEIRSEHSTIQMLLSKDRKLRFSELRQHLSEGGVCEMFALSLESGKKAEDTVWDEGSHFLDFFLRLFECVVLVDRTNAPPPDDRTAEEAGFGVPRLESRLAFEIQKGPQRNGRCLQTVLPVLQKQAVSAQLNVIIEHSVEEIRLSMLEVIALVVDAVGAPEEVFYAASSLMDRTVAAVLQMPGESEQTLLAQPGRQTLAVTCTCLALKLWDAAKNLLLPTFWGRYCVLVYSVTGQPSGSQWINEQTVLELLNYKLHVPTHLDFLDVLSVRCLPIEGDDCSERSEASADVDPEAGPGTEVVPHGSLPEPEDDSVALTPPSNAQLDGGVSSGMEDVPIPGGAGVSEETENLTEDDPDNKPEDCTPSPRTLAHALLRLSLAEASHLGMLPAAPAAAALLVSLVASNYYNAATFTVNPQVVSLLEDSQSFVSPIEILRAAKELLETWSCFVQEMVSDSNDVAVDGTMREGGDGQGEMALPEALKMRMRSLLKLLNDSSETSASSSSSAAPPPPPTSQQNVFSKVSAVLSRPQCKKMRKAICQFQPPSLRDLAAAVILSLRPVIASTAWQRALVRMRTSQSTPPMPSQPAARQPAVTTSPSNAAASSSSSSAAPWAALPSSPAAAAAAAAASDSDPKASFVSRQTPPSSDFGRGWRANPKLRRACEEIVRVNRAIFFSDDCGRGWKADFSLKRLCDDIKMKLPSESPLKFSPIPVQMGSGLGTDPHFQRKKAKREDEQERPNAEEEEGVDTTGGRVRGPSQRFGVYTRIPTPPPVRRGGRTPQSFALIASQFFLPSTGSITVPPILTSNAVLQVDGGVKEGSIEPPLPPSFGVRVNGEAVGGGSGSFAPPLPSSFGVRVNGEAVGGGSGSFAPPLPSSFGVRVNGEAVGGGSGSFAPPLPSSFGVRVNGEAVGGGSGSFAPPLPSSDGTHMIGGGVGGGSMGEDPIGTATTMAASSLHLAAVHASDVFVFGGPDGQMAQAEFSASVGPFSDGDLRLGGGVGAQGEVGQSNQMDEEESEVVNPQVPPAALLNDSLEVDQQHSS
uniref:Uncharacterized protein n=1 Tax=Chromera velia CCMP2878 TaxID=1169474 RepID=A0A0G4I3U8_9ALVE|eukprot:Cvel_10760.t1-p1 / transcript=Cvel_10760.t1 / gene=Cvel_10760 / organism=Chromera_velia_CCMP2878 / gene_product=Formin-like protein 20, putative / transcript_product=Formin-like protein 20, putative / location=Cvel_scaffold657:608-5792(+) / protein_length=1085 / sequence_SO=supercontig / SO=protein_coding / is_pseudo=false